MGLERFLVNKSVTLLASAARTADASSAQQTNTHWSGVHVFLNISSKSGTGTDTLQIKVEEKDPVTGNWIVVAQGATYAASTITNGDTKVLEVLPDTSAAAAGVTDVVQRGLGGMWRVTIDHVGSGSWTYTVGANYLK